MGACARRIAAVSVGMQASSLHAARADAAAWRMPSPHASPTHIKPLGVSPRAASHSGGIDRGRELVRHDHVQVGERTPALVQPEAVAREQLVGHGEPDLG